MIDFKNLETNKELLRTKYLLAEPFPYLEINNFCDERKLTDMLKEMPELTKRSRDSVFAENKFEKSRYFELGPLFNELHHDLHSEEFSEFLSYLTGKKVFIDPDNHGGGLHQGRGKSKLDMHLDYNYHPLNVNWWRELNVLFYFSPGWRTEYGGHLHLEDLRTGEKRELGIEFNKVIIQQCSSFSLHGYNYTNFPENQSRLSIATYAFTVHKNLIEKPRTTDWFPDRQGGSAIKQLLGRNIHRLIKVKTVLFGSGTSKNA